MSCEQVKSRVESWSLFGFFNEEQREERRNGKWRANGQESDDHGLRCSDDVHGCVAWFVASSEAAELVTIDFPRRVARFDLTFFRTVKVIMINYFISRICTCNLTLHVSLGSFPISLSHQTLTTTTTTHHHHHRPTQRAIKGHKGPYHTPPPPRSYPQPTPTSTPECTYFHPIPLFSLSSTRSLCSYCPPSHPADAK